MILGIDIGNTSVGFAILAKGRIRKSVRIEASSKKETLRREAVGACRSLRAQYPALEAAVVCSVVPGALAAVRTIVRNVWKAPVWVAGKDFSVPLRNRYRHPGQVGQDRLVGAYAASELYGTPAVIVDLGTAITVDVVSTRREYLGGIIVPGIRLSAESLFTKTALLPYVEIARPKEVIGRDTRSSILSGLFYGYGEMIGGLIGRASARLRRRPRVIITGGYTRLMKGYIAGPVDALDEGLVFRGLDLLARQRLAS